jgi:hypothetical protein
MCALAIMSIKLNNLFRPDKLQLRDGGFIWNWTSDWKLTNLEHSDSAMSKNGAGKRIFDFISMQARII